MLVRSVFSSAMKPWSYTSAIPASAMPWSILATVLFRTVRVLSTVQSSSKQTPFLIPVSTALADTSTV